MKFNGYVVIGYGILVMIGGLIGYLFADSLPSLIFGSLFGATLFAGGMGLLRDYFSAYFISLGCTGILALFFTYRYYTTLKLMPAGGMAIVSILVFILLLSSRLAPRKTKP